MTRSKTQLLRAMGVALPLLLLSSIAFGQTKEIEITVDDPRPMVAAARKIAEFYGIPINYEDMPTYHIGGQLSFSIPVEASTGKLSDLEAVRDALSAAVSAYNSSDLPLPGRYEFEEKNGVFFVRPVGRWDATGGGYPPLLSTPITLQEENREARQTLGLILRQIEQAVGVRVIGGLDRVAMGGVFPCVRSTGRGCGPFKFGALNEPAGHVIARLLTIMKCWGIRDPCSPSSASETAWDVGYYFGLYYTSGWGYGLAVDRFPNSRWFVSPAPSQPRPRPKPNPAGDATGDYRNPMGQYRRVP
ncbi:MAG: hypothetical protein HY648_04580 [Acidobacteria bacterium]|nr:hypothetical protein [Acidobacteriota bacterium]